MVGGNTIFGSPEATSRTCISDCLIKHDAEDCTRLAITHTTESRPEVCERRLAIDAPNQKASPRDVEMVAEAEAVSSLNGVVRWWSFENALITYICTIGTSAM